MRRSVSLRFVSLCCISIMTIGVTPSVTHGTEGDVSPGWTMGISEWNGEGYEIPAPVRADAPTTATVGSGLPYTMPVDPKLNPTADLYPTPDPNSGIIEPNALLTNIAPMSSQSSTSATLTFPAAPDEFAATPVANAPAPWLTGPETTPFGDLVPESLPINAPSEDLPDSKDSSPEEIPPPTEDTFTSHATIESPPLQEDVIRWYDYPRRWMRGWNSHAEFGLDGSSGNADTLAIQTGFELKRKSERTTLGIDVDYRQGSSRNVTVEDNGRFNLDYDYLFAESPWSGFAKYGMEWDKFKAFDLRLNLNGGIGYFWIRDDVTTLVTRFGAGASKELGAPVDDWIPEAVFGLEAERQLTSRQKIKGKVDYFPAWENFEDYRLVTDLAWEILLDGSDNLSLKLAATDRYDSTPQGARPNDLYYSLLLLYKF